MTAAAIARGTTGTDTPTRPATTWSAPSTRDREPSPVPKPLVIVESKTKADTIGRLPRSRLHGHGQRRPRPRPRQRAKGRSRSIDVDDHFQPDYVVLADKKQVVARPARRALKDADELYLATDEDREGEAISWHLLEVLKPNGSRSSGWCSTRSPSEAIEDAIDEPARPRHEARRGAGGSARPRPARRLRGLAGRSGAASAAARRPDACRASRRASSSSASARAWRSAAATYWDLDGTFARTRHRRSPRRSSSSTAVALAIGPRLRRRPPARSPPAPTSRSSTRPTRVALADRLGDAAVHGRVGRSRSRSPSGRRHRSRRRRCSRRRATSSASAPAARCRVAQGLYERGLHHLHADRLARRCRSRRSTRPARRSSSASATPTCPPQPRTYAQQGEERAGGPRGDPARRATGSAPPERRRAASCSRDERRLYELIWKRTVAQPDGRRPRPPRHAATRRRRRARAKQAVFQAIGSHVSSSSASARPTSTEPTTPRPSSRTARRCSRRSARARRVALRGARRRRVTPPSRRRATPRRAW